MNKTAIELVNGDVISMYGFTYTVARTELFTTGRVGIWIDAPAVFDAVPATAIFTVVEAAPAPA